MTAAMSVAPRPYTLQLLAHTIRALLCTAQSSSPPSSHARALTRRRAITRES